MSAISHRHSHDRPNTSAEPHVEYRPKLSHPALNILPTSRLD
ncbi:hypothetical protein BIWAKO_01066 [Bosea sp. BIWAKO-01]|nr:hypothetical protein BIWAKO_01066 [Bosea sp. BIWAKO-01]